MKIKADFVTNSSSTSYVIICSRNFSKKDLAQALGIQKGSLLWPLVDSLYESIERTREPARWAREIRDMYAGDFDAFLRDRYSEKVWMKVMEAEKQGRQVYVGDLSSGETEAESLFCGTSFECETARLYLNAFNCTW